jgi:peptidoglycan/LPS O-acetylase OafA/YrhL
MASAPWRSRSSSGFIVGTSSARTRQPNGPPGILLETVHSFRYFRSFYLRRALRIFPLYYAVLLIAAIAAHGVGLRTFAAPSGRIELTYWLYLQNWLPLVHRAGPLPLDHFWSLAIEEQFGQRVFALLGYEVVEGRIDRGHLREVDRVSFAPDPTMASRR